MSGKYTEEDLSHLSQTERDAMTATDEDDAILKEIAGEDDQDDDGEGVDVEDAEGDQFTQEQLDGIAAGTHDADGKLIPADPAADAAKDPAADTAKPADDAVLVVADDFDPDTVPPVSFKVVYSGELLPTFADQAAELDRKHDEGEITDSAWMKEMRLVEAQSKNQEAAQQEWAAEQAAFLKANKDFDPKVPENAENFKKINAEVVRLAKDPATSHLSGIQILYQAKHNLSEAMEYAEFKRLKAAGKDPAAAIKPVVPPKPAAARPGHQTLREVPAADGADVGESKFSALDKMTGVALEAALSRMSKEDQDAYARGE